MEANKKKRMIRRFYFQMSRVSQAIILSSTFHRIQINANYFLNNDLKRHFVKHVQPFLRAEKGDFQKWVFGWV